MHKHPSVVLQASVPRDRIPDYIVTAPARARWLREVLVETVQYLSKHPWPAKYPSNCNRFRERESGPLRVLHDLLIIEKPEHMPAPYHGNAFFLSEEHEEEHLRWCLADTDELAAESRRRLAAFIETWDPVGKEISEARETA